MCLCQYLYSSLGSRMPSNQQQQQRMAASLAEKIHLRVWVSSEGAFSPSYTRTFPPHHHNNNSVIRRLQSHLPFSPLDHGRQTRRTRDKRQIRSLRSPPSFLSAGIRRPRERFTARPSLAVAFNSALPQR